MKESIKKKLTHTRIETDKTITIIWNSMYSIAMFLFFAIVMIGVYTQLPPLTLVGMFLLVAQFIYTLVNYNPASKEIKNAMANDKVTASGNKFSTKNPLTVVITK